MKARHFYYSELEVYYGQFDKVATTIKDKLGVHEHLTDAQREKINTMLTAAETLMAGVKADQAAKKLYEDPAYTLDQIIGGIDSIKKETEAIFNLPPPPKSAEKKTEDSTAESGEKKKEAEAEAKPDAEMKNEEP